MDNGGNKQTYILVREATKKGYIEAMEGDSINISYPNSITKRGRVGKKVSQTILTSPNMATVGISDTQAYKQAGNSIVVNVLEALFKNLLQKSQIIMEKTKNI